MKQETIKKGTNMLKRVNVNDKLEVQVMLVALDNEYLVNASLVGESINLTQYSETFKQMSKAKEAFEQAYQAALKEAA